MENNLENKVEGEKNEKENTEYKYPYAIKMPLGAFGALVGSMAGVELSNKFGIDSFIARYSINVGLGVVCSFGMMRLSEPIKYYATKTADKVNNYWR